MPPDAGAAIMPIEDIEITADARERVRASRLSPASFREALPASLRGLFNAAKPCRHLPPELAFLVAEGLSPSKLEGAARSAAATGVTGEAALFALGVPDDLYYRLLARHLRCVYLERPVALSSEPFDVEAAASIGQAPLSPNPEGWRRVHAPRGTALRVLLASHEPELRGRFRGVITTPARLDAMLRRHDGPNLLERASDGLSNWDASLSARGDVARWQRKLGFGTMITAAVLVAASPLRSCEIGSALLFPLCFAFVVQRLCVTAASPASERLPPAARVPDHDLPVYTVLVPMFREARVLPQLVAALGNLDYPAAKLDIKLLLEACDHETIAAAARLRLPARFQPIVLEHRHPRTKPRALNIGLEAARGEFVVVFDAEDRPEPGQLRSAVTRFRAASPSVACVQARLAVDHANEAWITRMYALEYAALFGVIKPGLARLGLPIPLGGTSNHFRAEALRRVGGWDAWNVTEDIDLGYRLARFGYAVGSLDSTTYEEAPLTLPRWLPQRARWLKGWMVTLLVCGRDPVRLFRELGLRDGLSVAVSLAGTVLTALLGPPLAGLALFEIWRGAFEGDGSWSARAYAGLWAALVVAGAVSLVWPVATALRRLERRDISPLWLLTLPAYLLLVSVACWRALREAWRDPQAWNKTEHGLARSRADFGDWPVGKKPVAAR